MPLLSQEDFFSKYFDAFEEPLESSAENLEMVRSFILRKWRERSIANGTFRGDDKFDLSNSCKFSALFGSVVFGGDIAGNWHHVFNIVDDEILDINANSADVAGRCHIYDIDTEFIADPEFLSSMKSCVPRVEEWINEFASEYVKSLSPPSVR